MKKIILNTLIVITVFSLFSCATKRKKNEVGKLGKFFHNTTAQYNGYFNANELVEEAKVQLQGMHQENYREILSVYDYVNVENPDAVAGDMDEAIKKVTRVTALHEPSHWVDDCYTLMGKAQYLKHDYESSRETLEYFEEQFDPRNPYGRAYSKQKNSGRSKKDRRRLQKEREKERKAEQKERQKVREETQKEREQEREEQIKEREQEKKEREKARKKGRSSGKKKVRPPKTETPTKEVITPKKEEVKKEVVEKKKEVAEDELSEEQLKAKEKKRDALEKEQFSGGPLKHRPSFYEGLVYLAKTYIELERYGAAEELLKKLEESSYTSKEVKREMAVTKADLFIKVGRYDEALVALEDAISKTKERNDKARYNYVAAQIYEKSGNIEMATEKYDKSIKISRNYEMSFNAKINKVRSALSNNSISDKQAQNRLNAMISDPKNSDYIGQVHFAKAEIHLENNNIPSAREEFQRALASGGNTIHTQIAAYYKLAEIFYDDENYVQSKLYYDSTLQVIPEDDPRVSQIKRFSNNLGEIVSNINTIELQDSLLAISNMSKAQQMELAKELKKNGIVTETNETRTKNTNIVSSNARRGSGKSSFFAYNPVALRQGQLEFKRTWGQRALEDDWRRSIRNDANEEEEEEEVAVEDIEVSEGELRRILNAVPRTPEQKEQAHTKIQDAMMELGVLYRDRLANYKKSAEVLETLMKRYPDFEKADQAYYYMYLSYLELNKNKKASSIKKILASNFPDSQFTKLANNPNYADELNAEENKLETYYNETYTMFSNGKYNKVIERSKKSNDLFGVPNRLESKFALLLAMSTGHSSGKADYINALEKLTRRYPNTPEEVRANEILRFLKGDQEAFDNVLYDEALEEFKVDSAGLHYALVVVYELSQKQINEIKINISDFNKQYHKLAQLKISGISLNRENDSEIIMIRNFDNMDKSMAYYNSVLKNSTDFVKKHNYDIFMATQRNFREIVKKGSAKAYRQFFEKEYLNKN